MMRGNDHSVAEESRHHQVYPYRSRRENSGFPGTAHVAEQGRISHGSLARQCITRPPITFAAAGRGPGSRQAWPRPESPRTSTGACGIMSSKQQHQSQSDAGRLGQARNTRGTHVHDAVHDRGVRAAVRRENAVPASKSGCGDDAGTIPSAPRSLPELTWRLPPRRSDALTYARVGRTAMPASRQNMRSIGRRA